MTDAAELVEIVSRRHGILRVLSRSPRERRELVDDLEDAKSTVYKGVTQLLEMELIERTDEGLRPTLFGAVALRRYEELAQTADLSPVLGGLPAEAIDPVVFVGSEFVTPDAGSVGRHLEYAHHLLETADDVRGVVPAASTENVDVVSDRVNAGELTAEFVLSKELGDSLRGRWDDAVASLLDSGAVLWQTERHVPFGVFVVRGDESRMGIEFRDGNLVTGLLLNDTAESVDWAETQISRYKSDAERVTVER
jgi:predicted transcriptional regulator